MYKVLKFEHRSSTAKPGMKAPSSVSDSKPTGRLRKKVLSGYVLMNKLGMYDPPAVHMGVAHADRSDEHARAQLEVR